MLYFFRHAFLAIYEIFCILGFVTLKDLKSFRFQLVSYSFVSLKALCYFLPVSFCLTNDEFVRYKKVPIFCVIPSKYWNDFILIASEADPYCVIKCEGSKFKTSVVKNSQNPEWNEAFLIYRRNGSKNPIKVTLWNSNLTLDTFIGQTQISSLDPFDELTLELKGRRSKKEEIMPGQIKILIENFQNIENIWLIFLCLYVWTFGLCDNCTPGGKSEFFHIMKLPKTLLSWKSSGFYFPRQYFDLLK